ncbi:MAG: hypothetical protein ACR2MD_04235 [Aridibacter sp.]
MEMPKHGTFCWTEIASNDLNATKKIYTELFGWKINESENDEKGNVRRRNSTAAFYELHCG